MKKLFPRLLILVALIGAVIALKRSGIDLSLESLARQRGALNEAFVTNPLRIILLYLVVYIGVTAVSLPGAVILTLAGGAIFGLGLGTVLVSIASTTGATLAFLAARYLLGEAVQKRFGSKLEAINRGVAREGKSYLFALRLVPLFPFFAVNLLMALTPMRALTFFWVSQLGMLPGTLVFVNAGTQLATITSVRDILSAKVAFSFALLGVFPIVVKWLLAAVKNRKKLARFQRPSRFDYNVVVLGAGSGGLVTSYVVAALKGKVALVERHRMGGDCLNTGCVPSKALIRTTKLLADARRASEFGLRSLQPEFTFAEVMERVQRIISKVEPHDSVERYTGLGVDCVQGEARILSPFEVQVGERRLTTRSIVIATGGRPIVPDIAGLNLVPHYTSDTIWSLRELPRRLVVLGGGPIGCELAQCFARLGSAVTIVHRGSQLLPKEDPDASAFVQRSFERDGITLELGATPIRLERDGSDVVMVLSNGKRLAIDVVLLALGRRANVSGFGLEELGFAIRADGTLEADENLAATYPNVFTCGDVTGPYQFTHVASHQAGTAALNALLGSFKKFKVDYRVIPWCTFTDPEVARVGLNEHEARERQIPFEVTTYGIDDLDRAIADGDDEGVVKLLTAPGSDKILGVTIVGPHAGDLISEFVLAMKHGLGIKKIFGTIHIYPTLAEANRFVAGAWQRRRKPERILKILDKFHGWMRG
jgi:pyruvate/2-oxoglutarate dehydrogenase complex dihydrolipoamide dehydrogenase (E3) component/uncharacterized membrane protein YdjX (TVP38/TMEM64 family)